VGLQVCKVEQLLLAHCCMHHALATNLPHLVLLLLLLLLATGP
jgi:hypothetical protein